ncbi:MAG: CHAT domain-containing protein [Polyangiaceae bacterium]|nr:CHAT domain-containing protein [Polyangiaceae bacterium]
MAKPRRALAGLVVGLALGPLACRRPAPPTLDEASGVARQLEVEVSGCQSMRRGPLCEINEKRTLRLWVRGESNSEGLRLEAQTDRGPLSLPTPVEVGGGQRFELRLPEGARRLGLVAKGSGRTLWSIDVEARAVEPRLARALELRRAGRVAEAETIVRDARSSFGPDDRARADGLLGRLLLDRGGAVEAAEALVRSAEAARASGLVSVAVDDALTAALLFNVYGQRYLEARNLIARASEDARDYPDGRARLPFHEGVLAHETGDGRGALRALNRARTAAEKLGLESLTFFVEQHAGLALASLGRYRDAAERMGDLGEAALAQRAPCDRVTVLLNAAWVGLLARERGEAAGGAPPGPMLERALAEFSGGCSFQYNHKNVLLNLALASLQAGEIGAARQTLERARALRVASPLLGFWQTDLEARLALTANDASGALVAYRRQESLARSGPWPAARWRALAGQGQALEALGRLNEARAAYEAAEDELDDELLAVPFGEGRTCLVGDRERSARGLVAVLTRLGRAREAMDAARRARARLVRLSANAPRIASLAPEQRQRWEQALDAYAHERKRVEAELEASWQRPGDRSAPVEADPGRQGLLRALLDDAMAVLGAPPARGPLAGLPTPGEGEAFVAYFPAPDGGWLGFAADAEGARASKLGAVDPRAPEAELGAHLFGPFEALLARAKRVRFFPSGALRNVDLHALPFRGAPLVAHAPVAYGLDLPPEASPPAAASAASTMAPATTTTAPAGATVIADPTLDLAAARREGEHVYEALARHPGPRPRLLAGREATRDRLLASFPISSLVHYAGHGVFEGIDGTESAMLLAGGERLTPGDLLTQASAPAYVVLSGCETARSPEGVGEGLGLAQAFLLRGASAVIAPTRPVGDESSSRLFEAFYRHFPGTDAIAALALAQNALRAASPETDWRSFRALVP